MGSVEAGLIITIVATVIAAAGLAYSLHLAALAWAKFVCLGAGVAAASSGSVFFGWIMTRTRLGVAGVEVILMLIRPSTRNTSVRELYEM